MNNNPQNIISIVLRNLLAYFAYARNSYQRKCAEKKHVYEFIESYRSESGKQFVVAKIKDSMGKVFKLPAIELVTKRKDLLSGFIVDDMVNIIGLAATEKEPIVVQTKSISSKYFAFFAMIFGAALVTSNIASSKLISILGYTMTGGTLSYIFTYSLGDLITEVYGYKRARQLIWGAIFCNLFLVVFLQLTIIWQPSEYWHYQKEYALILGAIPRIVAASLISYWCGEFINAYVISRMKIAYNGQNLWLRVISSSLIGITVDTLLFVIIAYSGIVPLSDMFALSVRVYLFKVICEFASIPLVMWGINKLKTIETLDIFDVNTKFTPFSLDITYTDANNRMTSAKRNASDDESSIDDDKPYHPGYMAK